MMKALNCTNCGASLSAQSIQIDIATCEFCGTTFHIPESGMGDLLLRADFSSKVMPGWEVLNEDKVSFHKGNPSELRAHFDGQLYAHYVLKSSGVFDNFDVSVNIKFTEGNKEFIRAGLMTRLNDGNGYGFLISSKSSYIFFAYVKDDTGASVFTTIMDWTYHAALLAGLNVTNRLRVVCDQDRFRIYLNGVLAASFTDSRYALGKIQLAVVPSEESNLGVAFSDLQLREAPK